MEDLAKQQEQRTRLLRALHESTKGSTIIGADYLQLGAKLGFSQEETHAAMDYLTQVTHWARRTTLSPSAPQACMTAEGVVEVERAVHAETPQHERRAQFDAMSIEELQEGLAVDRFGHADSPKARLARSVLEAKLAERHEHGEVAGLKAEIDNLKQELRDKRTTLFWTRVTTYITATALVVAIAATWRNELADLFRWALVAVRLVPPPTHTLAVDVGPFRLDEFRPGWSESSGFSISLRSAFDTLGRTHSTICAPRSPPWNRIGRSEHHYRSP
jgi:hypothetical protein